MAHAEIQDNEIVVKVEWAEQNLPTQVPGLNYRSKTKMWHGRLSWGTCVTLRGVFGQKLTIGPGLVEWATKQRADWVDSNLILRDLTDFTSDDYEVDERLFPHQRAGIEFIRKTSSLICDSMGTGKSPQILAALRSRKGEGSLPALIICPNSVKSHWANEAATWFPECTPYVIGGGSATRRKQLDLALEDPTALVIINYEAVKLHSRLAPYGSIRLVRCIECGGPDETIKAAKCHKHPKELNKFEWKTVVVDEAHRMKDPQTQQTRACWAVMHQPSVQRRWALTGTPIANDVADLWSIMHGVAPLDFPTRTTFIDRFALQSWNQYAALHIVGVRPDTRAELEKIVHPRMRRMLKSIVLPDLPPKIRTVREAPMTAKQAAAYREMKRDLFTTLDDGEIVLASTNLVKAIRLLQFSSTYAEVDPEDQTLTLSEPSPKLDVLEDILAELSGQQVAVCALSRQLIDLAAARLDKPKAAMSGKPVSYRLLTGAVSMAEREFNLRDFQNGEAQCMLFTVGAGGVGVNMTAADTIVFLQRSWSMLENSQAEDRVHRVGSQRHESIHIIDIVAPDTIEVRQLARLQEKSQALEDIMHDMDRLRAAGIDTSELERRQSEILSGQVF